MLPYEFAKLPNTFFLQSTSLHFCIVIKIKFNLTKKLILHRNVTEYRANIFHGIPPQRHLVLIGFNYFYCYCRSFVSPVLVPLYIVSMTRCKKVTKQHKEIHQLNQKSKKKKQEKFNNDSLMLGTNAVGSNNSQYDDDNITYPYSMLDVYSTITTTSKHTES